jgi:hypothetical protein
MDQGARVRRLVAALCGLLGTISFAWAADLPVALPAAPPSAPPVAPNWNETIATEFRYFTWQSGRGCPTSAVPNGGRGSELYIPFAAQVVGRPNDDFKLEFLARGGWVSARQSTAGLTGEVATTTDTVMNGTVTYLGLNGIQPFASVSTNLPTGRSALFGSAANARMDPDLVDIPSFGEGFNIGPAAGFRMPITDSLLVTLSAGDTFRGGYLRESSLSAVAPVVQSATNVRPGDVFTATTGIAYGADPFTTSFIGSMTEETTTAQNGVPLYKPGTRYLVSGSFAYKWPTLGVTTLNASAAHSNRNDVLFLGATSLVREAMNTNSNLYRVGVQHLFPLGQLTIGPTETFLFRDHNGYDSTTLQFVPAKDRFATGALARVAISDNLTFNARMEYIWTREDDHPAPGGRQFSVLANAFVAGSAVPIVSSSGWMFVVGATGKF